MRRVFFPTPDQRYARRMARIDRWSRPIDGPVARAQAWANMLLADHGVFRLFWKNRHRVTDKLSRSNQPAPHDIAAFARMGIRTVVNLRGGREFGSYPLEVEACARHGLKLVDLPVRSRELPPREDIFAAERLFATIEYPAVIHCKSGADRAGFAAALFLVLHEGRPVAEAAGQLSTRYGHFRQSRTGVLDAFFETYLERNAKAPIEFRDWVANDYDPVEIRRAFHEDRLASFFVDKILRRE
ncbi:protein-tyrosine-phosphatase [Blastochloris tepida]|uniref:Protein-tyrosine-phosphatase n=2 Tax=Blastochloris tepida TaxID=2233851 RepID=A0A348G437_9HYPH|nr:protein-tyrosine-phosphatase [Blastochloris tepida]